MCSSSFVLDDRSFSIADSLCLRCARNSCRQANLHCYLLLRLNNWCLCLLRPCPCVWLCALPPECRPRPPRRQPAYNNRLRGKMLITERKQRTTRKWKKYRRHVPRRASHIRQSLLDSTCVCALRTDRTYVHAFNVNRVRRGCLFNGQSVRYRQKIQF